MTEDNKRLARAFAECLIAAMREHGIQSIESGAYADGPPEFLMASGDAVELYFEAYQLLLGCNGTVFAEIDL